MIDLWSKAELLHDRREEEEEFSSGKTLSQALPFPCKDHSSSIIYGSLITNQNLSNTIWLKRYPPIENGMRCSSLRTFPSLSRNLSGLNSSPSSQWLPCFAYMNDLYYTQWYQSSYWIYKLSKQKSPWGFQQRGHWQLYVLGESLPPQKCPWKWNVSQVLRLT